MEQWIDGSTGSLAAFKVHISDIPLEQIADTFNDHVFIGGLFLSEMAWPRDGLELKAGGLPKLKSQWLKQFPHNAPVSLQLDADVGKNTDFVTTTKLTVSQHHRMKWKDVPTDGRYFRVNCRLSDPMFKSIMAFASNGKTAHSDKFENVIILPVPHACEPCDTPLNSPQPLRTQRPMALPQIVIGHLNTENQIISSASLLTEETSLSKATIKEVKPKRWWQTKR